MSTQRMASRLITERLDIERVDIRKTLELWESIFRFPDYYWRYIPKIYGTYADFEKEMEYFALCAEGPLNIYWTISERSTKKGIGLISITLSDITDIDCSIAIILANKYRNKRYAQEAADAVIKLAFEDWGIQTITAEIVSDNEASKTLILKLGMRQVNIKTNSVPIWDDELKKFTRQGDALVYSMSNPQRTYY